MGLGEEVGGGGVGLEEADAVVLVEQEVEVAGGVGLNGVELALFATVRRPVKARLGGSGLTQRAGSAEGESREEEEGAMGV